MPQQVPRDDSIVQPPSQTNADGHLECPDCGCLDFRKRIGKRRYCGNCGWSIADAGIYRGPKCEACNGRLEAYKTGQWVEGKRNRSYICERCKLTFDTTETARN